MSLFGDEEQGDRIKKAPFHVHLRKREFDVRIKNNVEFDVAHPSIS